jgi:hypothetical protein
VKKIIFFCNWGESPEQILHRYRRQTPGCAGIWKDLKGVSDLDKADVIIVLEGLEKGLAIDFDRALLIKREPDFVSCSKSHPFKHSLNWSEGHCGVVWWLSKTYDELVEMEYPDKLHPASCIVSAKHRHRNKFIRSLFGKKWFQANREVPNMDLFGRGHSAKSYGSQYKGALGADSNCKLMGLLPYRYSMVLENSKQLNYWTEKLADAYLSWCIPIYWGCPNLDEFFNEETYRTIDFDADAATVSNIINESFDPAMIGSLSVEREKILNDYNIWEVIRKKIDSSYL